MSDLSSLMSIAPNNAAFMMGQNNASSLQYQQTQQQELQQIMMLKQAAEARTQQQFPLEQQKLQLGNDTTAAQLPGVQANSRLLGTQADNAAATSQSTNDLKNFDNENSITNQAATQLAAWAGKMKDVPDVQKPLAIQQMIDGMNMPQASKARLMARLQGVNGADLPQHLQDLSDQIFNATPEMQKAGLETSAKIQEGAAANASAERRAQILANGRIDASSASHSKTTEDLIRLAHTPTAKAEILESAAADAQATNPDLAAQYLVRAREARQRAVEDASVRNTPKVDAAATVQSGTVTNTPKAEATAPIGGQSPTGGVGAAGSAQRVLVTKPDGTRGTISADKLEAALKAGYKKVQ